MEQPILDRAEILVPLGAVAPVLFGEPAAAAGIELQDLIGRLSGSENVPASTTWPAEVPPGLPVIR